MPWKLQQNRSPAAAEVPGGLGSGRSGRGTHRQVVESLNTTAFGKTMVIAMAYVDFLRFQPHHSSIPPPLPPPLFLQNRIEVMNCMCVCLTFCVPSRSPSPRRSLDEAEAITSPISDGTPTRSIPCSGDNSLTRWHSRESYFILH